MLMPDLCWIDGSKCYASYENLTLDHCKLCQETRYNLKQLKLIEEEDKTKKGKGDVDA
jgi:hypothetical protein